MRTFRSSQKLTRREDEKKEILENLLIKEIKTMVKNLLKTIILEERKINC